QGLPRITRFVAGDEFALAIDGDQRVWSWGVGSLLGTRESASPGIPSRVIGVTQAINVAVGTGYAFALRTDGTVVCWPACPVPATPVAGATGVSRIDNLSGVIAIAAGQTQFLALKNDGTV